MSSQRPSNGAMKLVLALAGGSVLLSILGAPQFVSSTYQSYVPALFILGDSFADSGTNNYITNPLVPQSNIPPYGETFYYYPTGRWSNGRLVFDFIAAKLGLPSPPPYLKSPASTFYNGANFASAASGILTDTFSFLGIISLPVQVQQFEKVTGKLDKVFVSKSLVFVATGSNDLAYYASNATLQSTTTPDQFIQSLVDGLRTCILKIWAAGGRKIVVIGPGPIGCVPQSLAAANSTGPCVDSLNRQALKLAAGMSALVDELDGRFKTKTIVFASQYDFIYQLVQTGQSQGLHVTQRSTACCGGGLDNAVIRCGRGTYTLCPDVFKYLFWDFNHPTEVVYQKLADLFYTGSTTFIHPLDIQQLAAV